MLIAFYKKISNKCRKQADRGKICLFCLSYLSICIIICGRNYPYLQTVRQTYYRNCAARYRAACNAHLIGAIG